MEIEVIFGDDDLTPEEKRREELFDFQRALKDIDSSAPEKRYQACLSPLFISSKPLRRKLLKRFSELLDTEDREILIAVVAGLGRLHLLESVSFLEKVLRDPKTYKGAKTKYLIETILSALGESNQAQSASILFEFICGMYTRNPRGTHELGIAGLKALGHLAIYRCKEAVDFLRKLLNHPYQEVVNAAQSQLDISEQTKKTPLHCNPILFENPTNPYAILRVKPSAKV